jgi:hypothetical protein
LKDYQRCSWIQLVWEKMVHKSEYLEERRPGCARVGVPRTILPEDVTEPTTGIKFPTLLEDNSNPLHYLLQVTVQDYLGGPYLTPYLNLKNVN